MGNSGRWLVFAGVVALGAMACNGSGCSKLDPLPQGYSGPRMQGAVQMRLSATGLAKIEANPIGFAQQLLGPSLQAVVPSSCSGSPTVCCTGGVPIANCGPVQFDVAAKPGDDPRLVLTPGQGMSRIDATLRGRLQTVTDIPVTVLGASCFVKVNTAPGPKPDLQLDVPIALAQDATAGTTRLEAGPVTITRLTAEDVSITGSLACTLASLGLSFYLDTLKSALQDTIKQQLQASLCRKCPSGSAASCGPFATACTGGVCQIGNQCMQELGTSGHLLASSLFGGAPPGSAGALDLYEVAGSAYDLNGGVTLGTLGGLAPSGTAQDRCGPSAGVPPESPGAGLAEVFYMNARPDTKQPFDFGLGIHVDHAIRFFHSAYEGGVLCATLGTRAVPSMSSDSLLSTAPSLDNSTRGDRPVWIGFRPQSPPALSLGANTFTPTGAVDQPLLTLGFNKAEVDVVALIERQPIRVATVVGDMTIPLGLKSNAEGQVTLVTGSLPPPANVSLKNHDALLETPTTLAALAPSLQDTLVSELVGRVGPLALPQLAGLAIAPTAITTIPSEGKAIIALFGSLVPPSSGGGTVELGDPPSPPTPPTRVPLQVYSPLLLLAAMAALVRARRRTAAVTMLCLCLGELAAPVACGGDDSASSARKPPQGDSGAKPDSDAPGHPDAQYDADAGDVDIDSGADASPCVPAPCKAGELNPRLGAWNAVAKSSRTVVLTYDSEFGDAVLVELAGATQTKKPIDGVPSAPPTHAPTGYRGGVEAPGADVGAWPSVALAGDRVRAVYQDRDRGALVFALEDLTGHFAVHDIDDPTAPGVEAGAYASLALGATPAIAYVVKGIPQANGSRSTELRFARANSTTPSQPSDWTTSVVDSAIGSCAGLCGPDTCIAPETVSESERCVKATADCPTGCAKGQACVSGKCRLAVPKPVADLPSGTGLFARLLTLADGRFVIIHYDAVQSALLAQVETASGSGQFTATVLDGAGTDDRGLWSAAAIDDAGVIHVAYTDSLRHQVLSLSFTPGSPPGAPLMVDDGMRSGDRPHWVGAGLTAWLDGASFRLAYQDAMTADVVVATRTAAAWSHTDLVTGAALDGFALAAPASGTGPLVWDQLDPKDAKSHTLEVEATP